MPRKFTLIVTLCLILWAPLMKAQNVWQVISPDGKDTSLIVGTIHGKHAESKLPNHLILHKLDKTHLLLTEVALTADIYNNILFLQVDNPAHKLDQVLTAEEHTQLKNHLKKTYGLNLKYFQNLPPIFVWLVMMRTGVSMDNSPFMDEYYNTYAQEHDYEIVGLETFNGQMETLDTLPMNLQVSALKEVIENQPDVDNSGRLMKLYNKGKHKKLCKCAMKDFPKEVREVWINKRNTKLLPELAETLIKQPVVAVISICQLSGKKGLLKQLKAQGFQVSAVKNQ